MPSLKKLADFRLNLPSLGRPMTPPSFHTSSKLHSRNCCSRKCTQILDPIALKQSVVFTLQMPSPGRPMPPPPPPAPLPIDYGQYFAAPTQHVLMPSQPQLYGATTHPQQQQQQQVPDWQLQQQVPEQQMFSGMMGQPQQQFGLMAQTSLNGWEQQQQQQFGLMPQPGLNSWQQQQQPQQFGLMAEPGMQNWQQQQQQQQQQQDELASAGANQWQLASAKGVWVYLCLARSCCCS